jgi:hypothetical protein
MGKICSSNRRAGVADMVSDPSYTEALAGALSLSADGFSNSFGIRRMAAGSRRMGAGL